MSNWTFFVYDLETWVFLPTFVWDPKERRFLFVWLKLGIGLEANRSMF